MQLSFRRFNLNMKKKAEYQTEISGRKQGEFTIKTFFSKHACAYVTHIINNPT